MVIRNSQFGADCSTQSRYGTRKLRSGWNCSRGGLNISNTRN